MVAILVNRACGYAARGRSPWNSRFERWLFEAVHDCNGSGNFVLWLPNTLDFPAVGSQVFAGALGFLGCSGNLAGEFLRFLLVRGAIVCAHARRIFDCVVRVVLGPHAGRPELEAMAGSRSDCRLDDRHLLRHGVDAHPHSVRVAGKLLASLEKALSGGIQRLAWKPPAVRYSDFRVLPSHVDHKEDSLGQLFPNRLQGGMVLELTCLLSRLLFFARRFQLDSDPYSGCDRPVLVAQIRQRAKLWNARDTPSLYLLYWVF